MIWKAIYSSSSSTDATDPAEDMDICGQTEVGTKKDMRFVVFLGSVVSFPFPLEFYFALS